MGKAFGPKGDQIKAVSQNQSACTAARRSRLTSPASRDPPPTHRLPAPARPLLPCARPSPPRIRAIGARLRADSWLRARSSLAHAELSPGRGLAARCPPRLPPHRGPARGPRPLGPRPRPLRPPGRPPEPPGAPRRARAAAAAAAAAPGPLPRRRPSEAVMRALAAPAAPRAETQAQDGRFRLRLGGPSSRAAIPSPLP
ncbi:hypothetical protein R6Z07F_006115 [Ovis aries]|uniref:putative HTLV-1-related endogenous sequence n=1 Tax=Ovis aries TaxID=9940 RepID=UPI0005FB11A8|nr:putative HTLV-1-related endogenous sequence [Ovis aries]